MAIDFEWNSHGKCWSARKARRKLAWSEHKGLAFYDRERMRQPLQPIMHPNSFDGYAAPPSWAAIPKSWGEWKTTLAGDFHQSAAGSGQPVDDLDDPPIAQTAEYTLERCHVETVCAYRDVTRPGVRWERPKVFYRWELRFTDAVFRFVSRAIAEAALSELLKIRKAKHPRPRFAKHSSENAAVFFTDRKLRMLSDDSGVAESPTVLVPIETAA